MPPPPPPPATAVVTATALATTLAIATTTTTATTTATQVEGNVWVTGQLLVGVGEDSWWQEINGRFWLCHKNYPLRSIFELPYPLLEMLQ
jgi:hypothetical protein